MFIIFVHDHEYIDDYAIGPFDEALSAAAYANGVRLALQSDDSLVEVFELEDPKPWIDLAKRLCN